MLTNKRFHAFLLLPSVSHTAPPPPPFFVHTGSPTYIDQLSLSSHLPGPTNSLYDLSSALAHRLGALQPGGQPDLDHARRYLLRSFIEGKFGSWTLDDVGKTPQQIDKTVESFLNAQREEIDNRIKGVPQSKTQERKLDKKKMLDERGAKWEKKKAAQAALIN